MKLRWLATFLITLTQTAFAHASPVQFAVVVGVSDYPSSSDLWPLNYAHRDAIEVASALKQRGYTVRLLLNADAKKRAIENALEDAKAFFVDPADKNSVVFFFAGHGFTNEGVEWLMPEDGVASDPAGSGVSLSEVQRLLMASGANQRMLFIDACRENNSNTRGLSRVFDDSYLPEAEGTAISFSTKLGSTSLEVDALQQGVYSYFLKQGLLGATGYQELTFSSLHNYVSRNVKKYTAESGLKLQIPFRAGENSGEFTLGNRTDDIESTFLEAEISRLVLSMQEKNLEQLMATANLSSETIKLMNGLFDHYEDIEISQPPSVSFDDRGVQVRLDIDYVTDINGTRVIPSEKWRSLNFQSDRSAQGWSRLYE